MDANIVLAGGGVKGTVLGGCLGAVESKRITPVGFGGTSAGSIVSLLASVGYRGNELRNLLLDTELTAFLDDSGKTLAKFQKSCQKLTKRFKKRSILSCLSVRNVAGYFKTNLGLYRGIALRQFLTDAVRKKVRGLPPDADRITFKSLTDRECRPLRVVATDLKRNRAVIFGAGRPGEDCSVIDAVIASAAYPFVFSPVQINGMLLVDGGLSSNLPAFLFEEEYRQSRTPTLAFDLLAPSESRNAIDAKSGLDQFVRSLMGSAVEASDVLLRESTAGVSYFPITIPSGISTLDFVINRFQRESCYSKGFTEAAQLLEEYPPIRRTRMSGGDLQKEMIAHFGPLRLYEPVLSALMQQIDLVSTGRLGGLGPLRAHIMLLTGRPSNAASSTRIVTYSIGMNADPDGDLEIDQDAGCSGKAWETGEIAVANLEEASRDPTRWKMTFEQHSKVPKRVLSMISVPIPGNVHAESAPERPIGTLSVDCETPLPNTGWCTDNHQAIGIDPNAPPEVSAKVATIMFAWATVLGAMLP